LAAFVVHLNLLYYHPRDDHFVPDSIAVTLRYPEDDPLDASEMPSIFRRVFDLAYSMHVGNMQIGHAHPYASPWWSWPLALGNWVLYWTKNGRHIICLGNVLLWYPVFAGILVNFVRGVIALDVGSADSGMVVGYLVSYLPFALVPREMYLYHYAIPLLFGIMNLAAMIERHAGDEGRGFLLGLVAVLAGIGFVTWCPWVYGLKTPDFDFLVWNNKWRG
jgi:dolichyl-phosphate-mannose--protein O-mannosyl transferase